MDTKIFSKQTKALEHNLQHKHYWRDLQTYHSEGLRTPVFES